MTPLAYPTYKVFSKVKRWKNQKDPLISMVISLLSLSSPWSCFLSTCWQMVVSNLLVPFCWFISPLNRVINQRTKCTNYLLATMSHQVSPSLIAMLSTSLTRLPFFPWRQPAATAIIKPGKLILKKFPKYVVDGSEIRQTHQLIYSLSMFIPLFPGFYRKKSINSRLKQPNSLTITITIPFVATKYSTKSPAVFRFWRLLSHRCDRHLPSLLCKATKKFADELWFFPCRKERSQHLTVRSNPTLVRVLSKKGLKNHNISVVFSQQMLFLPCKYKG